MKEWKYFLKAIKGHLLAKILGLCSKVYEKIADRYVKSGKVLEAIYAYREGIECLELANKCSDAAIRYATIFRNMRIQK